MRLFVLGAGKMGSETARDLLDREVSPEVSHVTLGDARPEAVQSLTRSLNDSRVEAVQIDVREPEALGREIKDFDSVINTTWYDFNLKVMEASLKAKVHYTDLGGLYHMTLKQLKMHESFVKAGVTAVIGGGSSPGTTNILAAYGAGMLDRVEEIKIRFSGKPSKKGEFLFPYSARTILDECTMQPAVFRNGQTVFVEPFSEPEKMVFPEPVGQVEDVYHCIHSEIATLPLTYKEKGIKQVNFKQSIGENLTDPIKVMIKIGLTSREPIDVKREKVTPIDLLYRCVENLPAPAGPLLGGEAVTVVGEQNGERVEVILQTLFTPDKPPPKHDSTGVAASIIGQMLARGEVRIKGVLAPEVAVNPKRYLEELAKRNITYDVILERSAK